MKHRFLHKFLLLTGIIISGCTVPTHNPLTESDSPRQLHRTELPCNTQIDLTAAVNELSRAASSQMDQMKKMLVQYSNESPVCRTEIINALTQAMNKPNLNFVADRRSFLLWANASAILGELKAVEALDLLIEHLDLNDGEFSASMAHQPAFLAVKLIGPPAVPKLSLALRQNKNANIRLASALCLVEIGGADALTALERALLSETDHRIRRFVEISIDIVNKELSLRGHAVNDSDMDVLIDLRRKLLISYRRVN